MRTKEKAKLIARNGRAKCYWGRLESEGGLLSVKDNGDHILITAEVLTHFMPHIRDYFRARGVNTRSIVSHQMSDTKKERTVNGSFHKGSFLTVVLNYK